MGYMWENKPLQERKGLTSGFDSSNQYALLVHVEGNWKNGQLSLVSLTSIRGMSLHTINLSTSH